jgi:hypothetical protein
MKLWTAMQDIPIGLGKEDSLINNLVLSYLGYYAYKEAAEAFARSVASPRLALDPVLLHLMQSMDQRQSRPSIRFACCDRLMPFVPLSAAQFL